MIYKRFYIFPMDLTVKQIAALIFSTASDYGMPVRLCELIVSQSKHETDEYSSNAFIKNHNCFGYKFFPGSKWQIGKGIGSSEAHSNYAMYKTVEDSVGEICSWIKRRQFSGKFPADLKEITTAQDYATLLKQCNYYGDSLQHYVAGLLHFLNR